MTNDTRTADGKLAVFLPGLGAVSTTVIAGAMLARRGLARPIGSLTQLGRVPVDGVERPIGELVPLAGLDQLEFAAWDLFPENAYESALHAEVLSAKHLDAVREELSTITPMKAAFYPEFVRRLHGTHVKSAPSKMDMVEQLREDIRNTMRDRGADRAVAVWCASTETWVEPSAVHQSVRAFEEGLAKDDPSISPSMLYAWACLKERVPYANGSPSLSCDFPAAYELARELHVPIAGKDFKTGQTLMKTILAPGLKARLLGVNGWFSTNILGNRDGEVLDDPANFKTKEASKLGVLDSVFEPEAYPELYGNVYHKVRINYYPPRGDAKEGWDNIDLFGWLGYPMQLKLDFLCRDSILAAPIVLDLALLLDLAQRSDAHGVQEWMSFFFKAPTTPPGSRTVHDLFQQRDAVYAQLRRFAGVE